MLPALVTGGVERGTIDVAQALVQAGWRAMVASAGGPMVRELERAGAIHVSLPLDRKTPWGIRANAAALADVIRQNSVDIVHARSRAPAWSAVRACRETGVPLVTTFHGVYGVGPFGLKKPYNAVMTKGEKVIAISDFIRDHLEREYHVGPERIRVILRGIDLGAFNPDKVTSTRLIQLVTRLRLPDSTPVIMLPGRLTDWKGHHLLIDALAELKRRGGGVLNIRCLLVGQDQGRTAYREGVMAHAAAAGVDGSVHIVDDCHDLPAAYMLTDVVVSASTRPEAFGRVVAEAQAMGRPVVAPEHGAAAEIIIPGVTGWLFTPSDPVSLADALARALALGKEQREKLAAQAMTRARALFDKTEMCAKTIAVYDEVLARRTARS